MSCIHRLNDYGLVDAWILQRDVMKMTIGSSGDAGVSPSSSSSSSCVLATSTFFIPTDDGLCRHQKTFFAHMMPKPLVVNVSFFGFWGDLTVEDVGVWKGS